MRYDGGGLLWPNIENDGSGLRGGKFEVQLEEGGEGPNLLFLHGAGGYTGWTPFLDALAESFHVYAPAHPGVAGTTGLEYLDDLWDLVIFYEELMEELGLGRSHVLGHSYGGMLAAELAAHRADRVDRLALVAPLGLWLDEAPVADFFMLTPTERDPLLWHDPESEVAKNYGGEAGGSAREDGGGPGPDQDPVGHWQVRLADTGQGADQAGAPDYGADAAAVGRQRRDSAATVWTGFPGVAAQC